MDDQFISETETTMFPSSQTIRRQRVKVINDPIHGHFELPSYVLQVTDTPHVQRLRDLRQLGGTYLVFPGASHNRFEHSLGVSHLSAKFVNCLRENPRSVDAYQNPYDGHGHFLQSRKLVELGGLCHDLGHGPFSHLFDDMFLPVALSKYSMNDTSTWNQVMKHEQRSVKLFSHCVDRYHIDIDKHDINIVNDLIMGNKKSSQDSSSIPSFLYDVVANNTNGIDTDRFDYLARDVYNIGLQSSYGFDHRRLMKFAKVINDDICFHSKEMFNIYNLFLTRFQLHRSVYNHHTSTGIDAMIMDAFLQADNKLGISQSILDPQDFLTMTDSILAMIERSKDKALEGARHIIHRLRCRKLYRFVDEVLLPTGLCPKITPQEITGAQDVASTGINLVPDDIYIADINLHFGMKDKNPVDKVQFFRDWDDNHTEQICSRKASYIIPQHFQEKFVRVYVRREEEREGENRVKHAAQVAFGRLLKRMRLSSHSSTSRPRTGTSNPTGAHDCDGDGSEENTSNETEFGKNNPCHPLNADCSGDERILKRQRPNVNHIV